MCWPAFGLGSLEGAAVVASLGQDPRMTDSDRPLEEPEDEPVEVPTASRSIPELIAFIMQGVQRLTTSPDAIPEEWAPLVSTLARPTLRREHVDTQRALLRAIRRAAAVTTDPAGLAPLASAYLTLPEPGEDADQPVEDDVVDWMPPEEDGPLQE